MAQTIIALAKALGFSLGFFVLALAPFEFECPRTAAVLQFVRPQSRHSALALTLSVLGLIAFEFESQ